MTATITVTVDKPVYGGYCLASHDGMAVFVPDAVPGEKLAVKITRQSKNYAFGEIAEIIDPSPLRIPSPCPLYPRCGGCSYLCAGYDLELEWKKAVIQDSLTRVGKIPQADIPPMRTLSGERFHYRSHGTVKVLGEAPGFFEKGTNRLVPFKESGCLLLENSLNQAMLEHRCGGSEFRLAIDAAGEIFFSDEERGPLIEREGGIEYRRGIWNFFQANRYLRGSMIETVRDYAGLTGEDTFLDIGCGVGFFTLALAHHVRSGAGVDMDRSSIEYARHNARLNNITNVEFQSMAASQIHPGRLHPRVIVADPPRSGLDKKTRKTINAMAAPLLVYISCNPSTFARDTGDFIRDGYIMEELTFMDMFPGTHHIEVVARLVRP